MTRAVLRRRRLVLAAWLAVFVVSGLASLDLSRLLTNRFTLPGTETAAAERVLERAFDQKSTGTFTLVARTDGRAEAVLPELAAAAERAAAELPTARVAAVQPYGPDVAGALIVSELEPADAKRHTAAMRAAAGEVPGAETLLTGQPAIEHDLDPVFARDLLVGELIAVPIALLLLVFFFGTAAFLLPFAFAAATIPTALGIVWVFAHAMELTTYLQNMVTLIGLGIAIDYSLLVVNRYREELARAPSKEEALVTTMRTAGRTVVFSGSAVALGLALLLAMPLPFMRGFGVGGLTIPAVSVVCALTLLPVLLWYLGEPLDRVRLVPAAVIRRRADESAGFWGRLARQIMRRPLLFASAATAALLLLAAPLADLQVGPGSNEGIPRHLEAMRGLLALEEAVGAGAIAPTEVLVDSGRPGGVADPEVRAAVERLTAILEADPQVTAVVTGESRQHVDAERRWLRLQALGAEEYGRPESMAFVERLRGELVPAAGFPRGTRVLAGGGPPSGVDFLDLIYGAFPWVVAAVLVLAYVLLVRAFRSLLLPLKAIVLNLLSVGAAYGLLVAVFSWGAGEWLGLTPYDQIEGWIPVMLFAILFGLSMDYEVFLVARMREEWDAGASNEDAVAAGLAKTGRLVTAAGLIMVAAFTGLVGGTIVGLQQVGFGLAAAILVDVTIVRALLVPSAMKLFGRWNWWLPPWAAQLVRVAPSPLR